MAEAVASCVHCGFCLPACPTYLALGEEMDSPRGRILLMKGALEGELSQEEVLPHVDRCLGCLACVTACPSGVEYGELLTPFREMTEKGRSRSPMEELTRTLTNQTLPYPGRFRAAAVLGRLTRIFKPFLPAALRTMLDLLPEKLPPRVALLSGCVQQVLTPGINRATVDVLTSNGVEVVIPPRQGCCGALSMHTGAADQARALARRNFEAFNLSEVDAVVTNAAGCGSGMHEYPLLFAGEAEEQAARNFADKVQDVTVFLDALGIQPPPALPAPMTVAYHDACHLAHAQGVTDAPRRLYYVSMTRARHTLALGQLQKPNPLVKELRGSPTALWREPFELPPAAPELRRRYRQLNLKDVYLSFAGRQPSHSRVHAAIAALSPNDPLRVQQRSDRWDLLDQSGVVVGRLAQSFGPPVGMVCTHASVLAIATWGRQHSEPEYQEQLKCDTWEVVVPELIFEPS